jgi:hypothetical protein
MLGSTLQALVPVQQINRDRRLFGETCEDAQQEVFLFWKQ